MPVGDTVVREIYFHDEFDADPDGAGWTAYTTQPANDETFANAKAALLAGLNDTDGTANTRGTLPLSLKMERTVVTNLLLNDYPGAEAAYSLRKLDRNYTGDAIRIREDSGNTETDIGFTSGGDLDTAAIASHCGANNGYVVTWYDQSGNGRDVTQSTTTQQPLIYNGTTTISENVQPAMEFDGSNDRLDVTYTAAVNAHGIFVVVSYDNTANLNTTLSLLGSTAKKGDFVIRDDIYAVRFFTGNNDLDFLQWTAQAGQQLMVAMWDGFVPANSSTLPPDGTLAVYQNGSLSDDSATDSNYGIFGANQLSIGWDAFSAPIYLNGKMQELVFWDSDQSSNRTGIESNINAYFSIY